ncbi:hypothetical protein [Phorcysia thermohydrogeniphila]|uniref:Uncharacterized protein n=1 Tax=Phorcysia thermohydrogeniphila TaxID=936138 RepID=A0A4V2PDW0_9BACT|nr:hypothetical protein [Phorcysia thermohydrogeniphila]TCK06696.1 hypothetical protein CLV27_0502 [Phorcysia thermohydrogeniphila]
MKKAILLLILFLIFPLLSWSNSAKADCGNYRKGIYIWSKAFRVYSLEEINEFIVSRDIVAVKVSASAVIGSKEVKQFIERLKSEGIEVELVLSEPTYIFPEKWEKVKAKMEAIMEMGYDVHFDVEPHTLPDFKENRELYLALFVELLKKAYALTKQYGHRLTIAVNPYHYREVIPEVISNCDGTVVMIYGTKSVRRIAKLLSPFLSYEPESSVTLALRARDFEGELEMKSLMEKVCERTGVSSFVVHNLRQWKKLR